MARNGPEWPGMARNGPEWHGMARNGTEWIVAKGFWK
jgi:hypothetical protein